MMFRPCESYDQRVLHSTLVIRPEPVELRYVHDVFGNCVGGARLTGAASELSFESMVTLEHNPPALAREDQDLMDAAAATFPFAYGPEDMADLLRSIERQHPDPEETLARWARRFVRQDGPSGVLDLLSAMTRAIHADFRYAGRLEVGTQTPLETLHLGTGSCRDFAVLMIEAVRSLGLAARFVSGYIYCDDGGRGPRHAGGGHTHAWVRVYLPRCGWVDFDPTNGIVGSADLIRVAVARDPRQALPLCGAWSGEIADYLGMDVEVRVQAEQEAVSRAA